MLQRRTLIAATSLLIHAAAVAQDLPVAFVGARILPADADPIENGTLVIQSGRIAAVGSAADVLIPDDAQTRDVSGKTLIPGLICTHSHIGGPGGGDGSNPIQPETRVYDSIDPAAPGFRRAVAGGLTTLNIMPGSGHLISGQTIYVKLRGSRTIEGLMLRGPAGRPLGGLKMANGTNSMGGPPFPGTRAKSAALVRQAYTAAQDYRAKVIAAGDDPAKLPPRDLGLEVLGEVLAGRRVVHHHTHRHDDILTVLRLAREFNFRVVLHHVSEGWKVAEEIAAAKAPCSLILVDSPGGKREAVDLVFETGAALEKAGVLVAFHTDDLITDSRLFLRMPALAVRAGMSRAAALRSVTLAGAEILDIADRTGSLTAGKDADFVVLSGDPFSVYTKIEETWVEGVKVFDRADPKDRLVAVGGYGANHGERGRRTACCAPSAEAGR